MVRTVRPRRAPRPHTRDVGTIEMGSEIKAEKTIRVGVKTVLNSRSPSSSYAVVFEDDGETGCFYALDASLGEQPILDALHIYNVAAVSDRDVPSTLQIVWSTDGLKSALVINRFLHAVFNFQTCRGYCRNNFPPPSGNWSKEGHAWTDDAIEPFK